MKFTICLNNNHYEIILTASFALYFKSEDKTATQQTRLSDALDGISKYMNSKFTPERIGEDSSKEDDFEGLGKNLNDLSENVRDLKKDIADLKTVKELSTVCTKSVNYEIKKSFFFPTIFATSGKKVQDQN